MPELNWARFEDLPGDRRANFELLWRGAIRHNFGRYGKFKARAQQPGVEFHLILEQNCSLGEAGRWLGWQTKWWDIASGTKIGANRRADVEDSQAKTVRHLPGLTDWILCTRRPFTPQDQKWFDELTPGFGIDHQVADDLANLLVGDAELLRETYFGDLVLTPARLEALQTSAIAEVTERWFPEVHQSTDAEVTLRRMLAEVEAWKDLDVIGTEISTLIEVVERDVTANPLAAEVQQQLDLLIDNAKTVRQLLLDAHEHLTPVGDRTWLELDDAEIPALPPSTPPVLRRIRAANHPAALPCTNLVVHTRRAVDLARKVFGVLTVRLAVVKGDAGFGKTQLAAKLATATGSRPAGVLLHGRRLSAREDLNQLARQVTLAGRPVETFDALLAAVDAAAARAKCRLPIVIDGLNEAENPSDWEPLLRKLNLDLAQYPSVLVVCTIRTAFVPRAIPASVTDVINLDGFTEDLDDAVQKYFDHFNIDSSGSELPRELLRQPLALRIFCSVANPTPVNRVHLALLPRSLNEMFDEYLVAAARRIDQLHPNLSADDVLRALELLGIEMWEAGSREIPEGRVRELFGDVRWDGSILTALENEGVLIRQFAQDAEVNLGNSITSASQSGSQGLTVAVVYDLLAGHIIASAMARTGNRAFAHSLGTPEVVNRFLDDSDERHPLAADIFDALAFVLPRNGLSHLWQLVDGRLRQSALLRMTALSPSSVDQATADAWTQNLDSLLAHPGFWQRLQSARGVSGHPLNANYADALLRRMSVADRDLSWTEWLRATAPRMLAEVRAMAKHWNTSRERTEADALRARWISWMLASTVRDLRDAATAALYWYGRGDAPGLFALAAEGLAVNDYYVGERLVAAAYGVSTAHQTYDAAFDRHLAAYLKQLVSVVAGDKATNPTFHRLTRYYIAGTVEFARVHYPGAVPLTAVGGIEFAPGGLPKALESGDERRSEVESTIHMDFENYTVGRLFDDRRNYDYAHKGHRGAIDQILGVVYDLGWRMDRFSTIDSSIGRHNRDRGPSRIDRYGKKYGWVGLQLVIGVLTTRGERVYGLEVDIDPTFPQPSASLPLDIPTFASATPEDDAQWLIDGEVAIPNEFLHCDSLDGAQGPWVLVHAEIDVDGHRRGYGLFNTVAVDPAVFDRLLAWWLEVDHPGRDLIELPNAYYLFAGEIPWHHRMVTSGDDIAGTGTRTNPRDSEDGWIDPHEHEDPYIDAVRVYHPDDEHEKNAVGADDIPAKCGNASLAASYADILDKISVQEDNSGSLRPTVSTYRNLEFEVLSHAFAWEGHNSSENQEFAYVPSQRLSQQLGLRALPAGFDQIDANGRSAAKSFSAPAGVNGHLLYLREDLLREFAGGRTVVTFGFGERHVRLTWPEDMPDRIRNAYRDSRNVWRMHRIVVED